MKRNGIDNAQHCRSIARRGVTLLRTRNNGTDGDEEKVREPREWSDSFVVLSYMCAEQSIIIIVVSERHEQ
jgi:hypothetical protein